MKPSIIPQEKEFTVEFGKLLIRHQREVAETQAAGREIDRRAQKFARYLRAARSHAGLTPPELAEKANVPEPMIYALERGMISSKRMQVAHLQRLASALDEELEMFALLLDRDLSTPTVLVQKQIGNTIFSSGFRACLLLGLMLIALLVLSPSNYTENDHYLATRQEASVGGGTSNVQNTAPAQPIGVNVPRNTDLSIRSQEDELMIPQQDAPKHSLSELSNLLAYLLLYLVMLMSVRLYIIPFLEKRALKKGLGILGLVVQRMMVFGILLLCFLWALEELGLADKYYDTVGNIGNIPNLAVTLINGFSSINYFIFLINKIIISLMVFAVICKICIVIEPLVRRSLMPGAKAPG